MRNSISSAPLFVGTLLACALVATSCSPASPDEAVPFASDSLDHFLEQDQAPGVIVGRWPEGEEPSILVRGTAASGDPLLADQSVPLASISKLFVATVVHQLIIEERLALDDTVGSFLPTLPRGDAITIRHLMLHQSGLQDSGDAFVADVLSDLGRNWELDEVLAYVRAEPLAFEVPGTNTRYSDSNTQVLAKIVETVTGASIGVVLEARIFTPLEMEQSFYGPEALDRVAQSSFSGRARLESLLGEDAPDDIGELDQTALQTAFPASSGVWASNADLLTFFDALFRSDRLLPSEQVELMINTNEHEYGLGVEHFFGAVGHRGTYFGSHTAAAYDPESDLIVVVFGNAFDFDDYRTGPLLELVESTLE